MCEAEPKAIMRLRVCVSQKRSPNLLATVIWCWAVSNHILHTEPRVSIDLSTHDLDMPARPSHHTGWQHFCQSQSVSYKNSSRNSFVYTTTSFIKSDLFWHFITFRIIVEYLGIADARPAILTDVLPNLKL